MRLIKFSVPRLALIHAAIVNSATVETQQTEAGDML